MTTGDHFAAFEALPDVVLVIDADDQVVSASRAFPNGPAGGRSLRMVVHPSTEASLGIALASVRRTGIPSRIDVSVATESGTLAWYQLSLAPLAGQPGWLAGVAAEITARREVEDRLHRAEALMVDTQGTAHLGTWEWDPSQPHATWSAELYRIYGLTPETYTPSYEAYLTKVHPDDVAHVKAATERVFMEHKPYSHDERILRPDGEVRYLHTWAHAIVNDQGQLVRLIGVCQDITDRKLAEIELAQRATELAEANIALRAEAERRAKVEKLLVRAQKLEAIGTLTSGIAHDFNNMLGVILGYSSLLDRRVEDPQLRGYLNEIMSVIERAGRMTSQMLAFSSDHTIERQTVSIDRLIDELAPLLRRMIGEQVELVLELQSQRAPLAPSLAVYANPSQLEQVLMNLAVNARDAMPVGGTLTIATGAGTAEDGSPTVLVTVTDTGTGISDELQAQIFDPFFTTKEKGRGTGLGLSTVYGIITQSGGNVGVTSSIGSGARFEITLPRAAMLATGADANDEHAPHARSGETVLLVEDEAALRRVVRDTLESFGYRVLEAADAIAALELAEQDSNRIDIVLTDVVMPKLSGRELAEQVCARRPTARVLYMSGYTADVVLRQGIRDGSVALLRKPFSPGGLARKMREILDSPPMRPTPASF